MSALVLQMCPKCNNTLQEQYVNGNEILYCSKCKFKKTINTEPPIEVPILPNNYHKSKIIEEIEQPIIRPSSEYDEIDFAEMTKLSTKCDVVYEKTYPKLIPTFSEKKLEDLVENSILQAAIKAKIEKLYSFQEDAFEQIKGGKNVVITAPTASGKTQAFLLPILDKIISNPNPGKVSALFIYPTKALAGDQQSNIEDFAENCGVTIQRLDGDSRKNPAYRNQIISNPPNILATNFDMISWHLSRKNKGSFSAMFAKALSDLKIVVVDETHKCTGFYGSNISWILKRLQRINPNLQFVASSATLDNPQDFCSKLFPVSMEHIDGIGTRGEIKLQFLKPKINYLDLMIDITRQFGLRNHQVLAFNKSRLDAELLAIDGSDSKLNIEVHRSGMNPERRKLVEIALRENKIQAVSCTPTLELGINVGHIDGVVSAFTSPGRLTQRIGRAGRRGQNAYAYMILDESNPISKYYLNNPEEYFKDHKYHSINFDNPLVDENQILLMAKDMPLSKDELKDHSKVITKLVSEGKLSQNGDYLQCTELGWSQVESWSIRDMGNNVSLHDGNRDFGEIEMPLAFEWLYPGAIYFHDKKTYRCKEFHNGRYAKAKLVLEHTHNITYPIKSKSADVKKIFSEKMYESIKVMYDSVHITQCIYKYMEKNRKGTFEKSQQYPVEPPQYSNVDTLGVLLKFEGFGSSSSVVKMKESFHGESDSSLHAVKHLLIHAAKMIIGAESSEIDGMVDSIQGTILVYDNSMNGGNGISNAIYEKLPLILNRALEIVDQCNCKEAKGCPLCTHWEGCSQLNHDLSKEGAKKLLESIVKPITENNEELKW